MCSRIKDCLREKEPNYLYPFLILRDYSREDILEEIEAIFQSGCGGFLIECRGYTGWGEERWWGDFGFILEEARKRGMKVWLTDDVKVPSGKANWAVRDKYPSLRKKNLLCYTVDTVGPSSGAGILIEPFLGEEGELFSAIAYRVDGSDASPIYSDACEITENLKDGIIFWDVPEGFWRVFVIVHTSKGRVTSFDDYVDFLNPEACELMISEVYEPHYQRFAEYFGNTLEAFFTDEPQFGNRAEAKYNFCEKLGNINYVLPYREDMIKILSDKNGWTEEETRLLLPALWNNIGGKTPVIRRSYMDFATEEYSKNFVQRLGKWCAEHGVIYTGHVIEDMNANMRLSCSTGHIFRSQKGQNTAGFDLVLQQLKVGSRKISHSAPNASKYSSPAFYLYVLGRLASSVGHLYPEMDGRVMCENAGAGGWSEGLPTRKYMLDAMMLGGANIVVPMVFDPLRDNNMLPPFAYDHGENPQYPFTKPLMRYTNRLCHIMSGGVHRANALVYYPAEGDWGGNINLPENTVAPLALSHVDYDFVPWDILRDGEASVKDGKICINRESFDALVVPYCEFLPLEILECFEKLSESIPVIFADGYPTVSETGKLFSSEKTLVMSANDIPAWFKEKGFVDFTVDGCEDLMHMHLSHGKTESYLMFNHSASKPIDEDIKFPYSGEYTVYDAWTNTYKKGYTSDGLVHLYLPQRSTLIVIFGKLLLSSDASELKIATDNLGWSPIASDTVFSLEMRYANSTEWTSQPSIRAKELKNLAPDFTRFTGTLKYKAKITLDKAPRFIDLGEVGEIAELFVNGVSLGVCLGTPFRFYVKDAWRDGENEIEILVATSCAYRRRDSMSTLLPLPPTGILGPVRFV